MSEEDKKPHRVLLLNDDQTPMEFVVHVLENFFHMKTAAAQELMLRVHDEGSGVCGIYPRDEAAKLVEAVLGFAREHNHPLQCVMEKRA